jgi:hypothetical protein
MNDDIPSRVLPIEGRGRYEDSYFALKRASPRELIDRISMSAPSSAQPPRNRSRSGMASVQAALPVKKNAH